MTLKSNGILQRVQSLIPWLIVVFGIALRISQYSLDRSLYLDESYLAKNVVERSMSELRRPLQIDQQMPAGFLLCVKLATVTLGISEKALRLVPLVSGILSMFFFSLLSRRLLPRPAADFTSLLFAACPPLIFFSADLKPYSTEALMTILILLASLSAVKSGMKMGQLMMLGVIGAASLWFSFSAAYVLVGVGLTLISLAVSNRNWAQLSRLSVVAVVWGIGFVSIWSQQLKYLGAGPTWASVLSDIVATVIPGQSEQIWTYPQRFFSFVANPVGLTYPCLAGLAGAIGVGAMIRHSQPNAALLLSPIVASLLICGFRIYPISDRSIVFLTPLLLPIIVAGIDFIRRNINQPGIGWAWIFVVACICSDMAYAANAHVTKRKMYSNTLVPPDRVEDIKPLMAHIREKWQPGDLVYLYGKNYVTFEFYAEQFGFTSSDSVRGMDTNRVKSSWKDIEDDLSNLSGRSRVWFIFTHNWLDNEVDDRKLYRYFLDKLGKCLDSFERPQSIDAAAYLYDLSHAKE